MLQGLGVRRMRDAKVHVARLKTVSTAARQKFESDFNCAVSRRGMEVMPFLLSVFLVGKVIAVAGVVCTVTISYYRSISEL